MKIRRLSLTNMRSRRALDLDVGAGLTVLVGPNGAGKTTVLEAITLTLGGELLRTGSVRDLISRGEEHLRVEIELEAGDGGVVTAAAAYSHDGDRRLTADGAPLADASRWRDALPVRTFVPDDLRLIKGSPRRRREYLDTLAGRQRPEHTVALRRYEEALAQRNALLRTNRTSLDDGQFAPWEAILAQAGLAVACCREATLGSFITPFQAMHCELTGDPSGTLRLTYRTNVADMEEDVYQARLADMRAADRQRTFTHLGPHRDDFRLVRAGLDMRECASQGEQRAALLTLVLAEWEHLCASGPDPVLLLDDVMSELDEARRRALVRTLQRGKQVVITTTDLRYFSTTELRDATVVELPDG